MKALKCDACNGMLVSIDEGDMFVCEFCGIKYTKERIKTKLQEITGSVSVNNPVETYVGDVEKERMIVDAQGLMQAGLDSEAFHVFYKFADQFPNDYRGWWGMIQTGDVEFDGAIYKNAMALAPEKIKQEITTYQQLKKVSYELSLCKNNLETLNKNIIFGEQYYRDVKSHLFACLIMLLTGVVFFCLGPISTIIGLLGIGLAILSIHLLREEWPRFCGLGRSKRNLEEMKEEQLCLRRKETDLENQKKALLNK